MKNISKVIVVILLVFTVIRVSKNVIPFDTETNYYIATANLNVRIGAGTGYAISFTLQKGDEVEIISKKYNWYEIKHLEKTGYAYSKYLKYSRTVSNTNELDTRYRAIQQTISHIFVGIFAVISLLGGFIIFRKIRDRQLLKTVTTSNRGTWSERDLVLKLLKYGIPAQTIFHDLYVRKHRGGFSQIDLVVTTKVGIIVFEVKDYSGWIFGTGDQRQWTKVLASGKPTYSFYNPIMQNNKHIEELRKKHDQFEHVPFYSILVFYGNCVLKDISPIPTGTFIVKSNSVFDAMKIILKNNELVQYTDENEIIRVLREAVENGGNKEIRMQHNENVNNMLGEDE